MSALVIKDLTCVEELDSQGMAGVHGGVIGACAPTPTYEYGMTLGDVLAGVAQWAGNILKQNGKNCDGTAGTPK